MQIGIFTIGDVTTDPTTGKTPSENEKIKNTIKIAKHAEQAGFDVFATGQHHNPPFAAPGNPPVLLAYLAAQTGKIILSAATTLTRRVERAGTEFGQLLGVNLPRRRRASSQAQGLTVTPFEKLLGL